MITSWIERKKYIDKYDDDRDNYEFELLSILLCDQKLFERCYIEPKHFESIYYAQVFLDMKNCYNKYKMIDHYVIERKNKCFIDFAKECINHYSTSAHFEYYIEKIVEHYKVRMIELNIKNYNDGMYDIQEMQDNINNINKEFINIDDEEEMSVDDIIELVTKDDENLMFKQFQSFNRIGFIKNGIHVIGARPSVGKSAMAINILNDLSNRYNCIYLNMEMNRQKIYQRILASEGGIIIDSMKNAKNNDKTFMILKNAVMRSKNRKFKIIDGSQTVKSINRIVARETQKGHLILFIDYIGYVYTNKRNQSDTERIGEVVRDIQLMTKDYDLTVFMLAQINREGNDMPQITHLKHSGELEQSAETVLLLHNPSKDLNEERPIYDVYVPKNRNGKQGKINLMFEKPMQRFSEVVDPTRGY